VQTAETEIEDIRSWRLHVLLLSGADLRSAEKLAASDADLHEAVELIEAGCPPETAARILI
jgi:hypothetical protein